MGALCSRIKTRKPFARLRQYIQDRRERKRERKRQRELNILDVQAEQAAADAAPMINSPILSGAASTHSSLASTSLHVSSENSCHSLHASNSNISGSSCTSNTRSDSDLQNWNMLARQTSSDDDDDGSDDSDGEGIPLGAKGASDDLLHDGSRHRSDMDVDEDIGTSYRIRRFISDQSAVINRAAEVEDTRQRAFHRTTTSLTATVARNRMPTIPEIDILASLANVAQPLPTFPPRPERQGHIPDDFYLPGFIP